MQRLRLFATLLALLCGGGLAIRAGGAPSSGRHIAVVAGVSAYDAGSRVPALPSCETSARALAASLGREADTTLLVRRVTRQALLEAVRRAAARCSAQDVLLVLLVAAGDARGLQASDGIVSPAEIRAAMAGTSARQRVLCVDAPAGEGWVGESEGGTGVTLVSSQEAQRAWSMLFPDEDVVRFESAASHAWARALQSDASGWKGDLGHKGSVAVEDLRMCGDEAAAQAVPHFEAQRALDARLAMRVLEAVRPSAARRLRDGADVEIESLSDALGKVRFEQLAGILETLCHREMREALPSTRRRIIEALSRDRPMDALQAVHDVLLDEELLETPSPVETRMWKRLSPTGDDRVCLVLPARQAAAVRGALDATVLGAIGHSRYRVPYGRYEARLDADPRARLELEVLGTSVRGRWEGELHGQWLRGDWQGLFDPRTGRVEGRMVNRCQRKGRSEGAPADMTWPAIFEGSVSDGGRVLSGRWQSASLRLPWRGRWRVAK